MRVAVVGGSCSGKTTLSSRLARLLGVPHIELDALHHGPNWDEAPAEVLQERVRAALAEAADGWVVDGNYHAKLGRLVLDQSDLVVFLDPPFATALRRALRRTFARVVFRRELWNGNRETFRNAFFSWYGIPFWVVRTHRPLRTKMAERLAGDDVVHVRSPREVERFVQSIQATATMSGSSNGSELQNTPPLRET